MTRPDPEFRPDYRVVDENGTPLEHVRWVDPDELPSNPKQPTVATSERPYPPYSGDDTTCPKCDGSVGQRYQPAGTVWRAQGVSMYGQGPEWLLRECNDCDYQWPEMCADAS